MLTIVIKSGVVITQEQLKELLESKGIVEGEYEVITEEEYETRTNIEVPDIEKLTAFPEIVDLSGWAAEKERREKKFKSDQEKWRRRFSNKK